MTSAQAPVKKMWEEDTPALYAGRLKSTIPAMPQVGDAFQVISSRPEMAKPSLIFLACIVRDTPEKLVALRALASAVSILFNDSTNFLGSPLAPEDLTGIDAVADDSIPSMTLLDTNFEGAPELTLADIQAYLEIDTDELGGYFGDLFVAGVKRLTTENSTAFNEKRLPTIQATIARNPKIFVPGSAFLDERVLNKMYAAFTSFAAPRAQLIHRVALKMNTIRYGPVVTFTAIFLLLVDNGMGTMRIIKEAILKCPWIRHEFPELAPELEAANDGQTMIRMADPPTRPFIKTIFGSQFVPVAQKDVANLLGVCKEVMQHFVPTMAQFRGGYITANQQAIVAARLAGPASQPAAI